MLMFQLILKILKLLQMRKNNYLLFLLKLMILILLKLYINLKFCMMNQFCLKEMSMMKYFIKMWSMTCLMLMTILYINVYEQLGCNQPRSYKEALKSKNIVE